METNQVKRAIDTNLVCLRVTKQDALTILNRAREGKQVKRKWSVAFVLALGLILLAVTAFAISALTGLIFLDRQNNGAPLNLVTVDDTLFFSTDRGVMSWLPDSGEPELLLTQTELSNHGISIMDAMLFYSGKLMMLDQESKKMWAYDNGVLTMVLDYSQTALGSLGTHFENLIYQDGSLFVRALPEGGHEEDAILYRASITEGSVETLPIPGVLELTSYKQGELLALQRNEQDQDAVILIDAQTGSMKEELTSMPLLGIQGITYSTSADAICAMVSGSLSVWNGSKWLPIRKHSIPERCFYFSAIGDGYVAAGLSGVQYIAFKGEEDGLNLTIRGFMPANNLDHNYELAHPDISVTRYTDTHFYAEQVQQAIQSGDMTDLFLVKADTGLIDLMKDGLLEPLSSSGMLVEENSRLIKTFFDATAPNGILLAIPSDVMISGWTLQGDAETTAPMTFIELLRNAIQWETDAVEHTGTMFLANKYASESWTKEDYANYLLRQYILESEDKGGVIDFSSQAWVNSLKALKDVPLSSAEGSTSVFAANAFVSLRGLREDEPRAGQYIKPPAIAVESAPHIPARLHVYVLNPNSQNKDAAIAYLEYIAAHRNAETDALLYPDSASPSLYPYMDEWTNDIMEVQYTLDATDGLETDNDALAARIDAFQSAPSSWEVTAEALEGYRQDVVPYLDLMLHPLLADQSGLYDKTYQDMLATVHAFLNGDTTIEQCTDVLTGLASKERAIQ